MNEHCGFLLLFLPSRHRIHGRRSASAGYAKTMDQVVGVGGWHLVCLWRMRDFLSATERQSHRSKLIVSGGGGYSDYSALSLSLSSSMRQDNIASSRKWRTRTPTTTMDSRWETHTKNLNYMPPEQIICQHL